MNSIIQTKGGHRLRVENDHCDDRPNARALLYAERRAAGITALSQNVKECHVFGDSTQRNLRPFSGKLLSQKAQRGSWRVYPSRQGLNQRLGGGATGLRILPGDQITVDHHVVPPFGHNLHLGA